MANELPLRFGAYTLLHVLGRGGNGTAFLALPRDRRSSLGPVVLKALHNEAARDEVGRARFEHEAKLAVAIDVSSIATVYDVGLVGETPYIVMELVRGMGLNRLLALLRDRNVALPIDTVLGIVRSALSGLVELHEARDNEGNALGAIHRDLSPGNMMLEESGRVRILDLGMGRSSLRETKTATGVIIGTPGYLSPEQVLGGAVTQRSDVYSIGTLFWELLVGRRYIHRGELATVLAETVKKVFDPPSAFRRELSPQFDDVTRRALEKDPEHRYPSSAEFLRDVEMLTETTQPPDDPTSVRVVELSSLYSLDLPEKALAELTEHELEDTVVAKDTVVFAQRRDTMPPLSSQTVTAPLPTSASVPVQRPPSTTPLIAYIAILGLVTAVLSAALYVRTAPRNVEIIFPEEPTADAPQRAPAIAPRAPEPEAPKPVEERPAPVQPAAAKKTATPPAPAPAPAKTQPARVLSVEELMKNINARARFVKKTRPEVAARVDELINAGLFEAAAGDTPGVRAKLEAITRELDALTASGEKREAPPGR